LASLIAVFPFDLLALAEDGVPPLLGRQPLGRPLFFGSSPPSLQPCRKTGLRITVGKHRLHGFYVSITYLLGVSVFSSFTGCTEFPLPFLPRRLVETDSNTNLTTNKFQG
jgi:hypothetical protein